MDTPMHRRMHMWWSAFDTKYMQPVFGGEWLQFLVVKFLDSDMDAASSKRQQVPGVAACNSASCAGFQYDRKSLSTLLYSEYVALTRTTCVCAGPLYRVTS